MELGLWSSLWANCALGTTIFTLPAVPIIGIENQTIQTVDDTLRHDHETQTVDFCSSDSEDSEAAEETDKEGETDNTLAEPNHFSTTCSTSDSNSVHSTVDNNNEVTQSVEDNTTKITTNKKKKKSHQRIRYSREEYRCTLCPYTCTTEKAFVRHLRSHTDDSEVSKDKEQMELPRLSCPVCGKDRDGESALNKHMMRHRDNRHFCCDICAFRTVQLKKLIQHRRMHTGERPHLCPHCVYRSARRDNLRSHVRRVHKRDNLICDTFSPRGILVVPSSNSSTSKEK